MQKLCKWIDEHGLRRAAVTNAPRPNGELIISILDLSNFFEILVIGNECEWAKPFPDPYLTALKALEISHKHAFVFEVWLSGNCKLLHKNQYLFIRNLIQLSFLFLISVLVVKGFCFRSESWCSSWDASSGFRHQKPWKTITRCWSLLCYQRFWWPKSVDFIGRLARDKGIDHITLLEYSMLLCRNWICFFIVILWWFHLRP